MKFAVTFPGQGSQKVGMGLSLYENYKSAKEVFDEIDESLGQKLTTLMFEGPDDELTLTENAQPALMAVSLAAYKVLEMDYGIDLANAASYFAGHSLGEYSALAALKAISISDTAKLLKLRGQSMQAAVPRGEGAMAAILGLDIDAVREVISNISADDGVCECANDNANGQVVISGSKLAVEKAIELAKGKGARRAMLLNVSAPFHCSLMQPAQDAMREVLVETDICDVSVPLICNVDAAPILDAETIRQKLVEQVTGSVRWKETIEFMSKNEIAEILEVGSGKVLSGLVKRIDRNIKTFNLETKEDIEAFKTK